MGRILLISLGAALAMLQLNPVSASGQNPEVNYDESKVPSYTLEDPLSFTDGGTVRNAADWERRREEILGIFQKEMFGKMPPRPDTLVLDCFDQGSTLEGMALRRQVRMWFRADRSGPHIDWLIVSPAYSKEPTPVILMLNYLGNHTILKDKEIPVTQSWMRRNPAQGRTSNYSDGTDRGSLSDQEGTTIIPVATIIARGYSYMTACYCDVSPDPGREDEDYRKLQKSFAFTGVFDLWGPRDTTRTDNTGSLCAWSWALSRGADLVEKTPGLDASRMVVTGCSRLGKAALLAGAFDGRFSITVPVQTGGGGVPLSKRVFGENIGTATRAFPHWYCKALSKYAWNEAEMPFDQHLLLSCVAPRGLLVEGFGSRWFDPKGEFLSVQAASPVWSLLTGNGMPSTTYPAEFETSAIGSRLGYVRRAGEHGINCYDWMWMLDFADKYFSTACSESHTSPASRKKPSSSRRIRR